MSFKIVNEKEKWERAHTRSYNLDFAAQTAYKMSFSFWRRRKKEEENPISSVFVLVICYVYSLGKESSPSLLLFHSNLQDFAKLCKLTL